MSANFQKMTTQLMTSMTKATTAGLNFMINFDPNNF